MSDSKIEAVGRVTAVFEAEPVPTSEQIGNLQVLLSALRILSLEGAATSFSERLAALKTKTTNTDKAG